MNPVRKIGQRLGPYLSPGLAWRLRYLNAHHRWPRLDPPRTLNEKILWRILFDRRPGLVRCTDKDAAKKMIATSCPDIRVPETLWKGSDPRELVDVDLPERWVIKPNNSTALISDGRAQVDAVEAERLTELTRGWVDGPYDSSSAWRWPWAYSQAESCLLVEEMVGERIGQVDWRGFVIGGSLRLVLVTDNVLVYPASASVFLNPEMERIAVSRKTSPPEPPGAEVDSPPAGLRSAFERIAFATRLEAVRIDLFHVDGEFWFSEATAYPLDAMGPFVPRSFDFELGSFWPDQESLCETG